MKGKVLIYHFILKARKLLTIDFSLNSISTFKNKHLPLLLHSLMFPVTLSDLTETLEMRENLQKQLQEIMSATKLTSGRRASSRLARLGSGSLDSPQTPEILGRMGRRSRTLEALRYPHTHLTPYHTTLHSVLAELLLLSSSY